MEILLHPESKHGLLALVKSPAHAFMLTGPIGSGKRTVADWLTQKILGVCQLENQPGLLYIEPNDKGTISIESVRSVTMFLRLKTTGQQLIRRVIVIESAHNMTLEAQNAFLKVLEEPPSDTRIILTATEGYSLLPTIYSRVQVVRIQSPSIAMLTDHFKNHHVSLEDIQRAYMLSGGLIGLMASLLDENSQHALLTYVERTKKFLGASIFDRLCHFDDYAKNRDELKLFIEALKRLSTSAFDQSAHQGKHTQAKQWHRIRRVAQESEATLRHNPSIKLLLTDLSLRM
ncbi:MAG: hypothetical protein NVS1B7_3230 [Candidatus Saccharimonadales bacterium]